MNKVYGTTIDLGNKNNSHTLMFEFIRHLRADRSARILEIGCATGFFGMFLKEHGYEVWGIEMSPQQAKIASERLDYVYTGKIEDFLSSEIAEGKTFDFIVFGDVLEHLVDPLDVLKSCLPILAPGGAILASIPNVAHLGVRLMLLEGRWEYSPFGILDNTHLRFFTRQSIMDLFSLAGMAIEKIHTVRLPLEAAGISTSQKMRDLVGPLIEDDDQDVFQYVVMATKSSPSTDMKKQIFSCVGNGLHVLCLPPRENWPIGNIRLVNPLEEWRQRFGGVTRIKGLYSHTDQDLTWADVVVFQRHSDTAMLMLLAKLQNMGKPTVFDMDDLLTEIPPYLACYPSFVRNKWNLEEALRMADAVTVTTPLLQARLDQYNEHVYVVPNCASNDYDCIRHYETDGVRVRLIIASTDMVRVDLVVAALRRIQNELEGVCIVGIGPPGATLRDQGLRVECHEIMDYNAFGQFISSLDNSVGIIPLPDSEFCSCKSAIKYVNYSLAGIPTVCSGVSPYKEVITNQVTGILVENQEEAWFEAVKELVESAEKRRKISRAAFEFCSSEFSITRMAEAWNQVFSTVRPHQGKKWSEQELKAWFRRRRRDRLMELSRHPSAYLLLIRILLREGKNSSYTTLKIILQEGKNFCRRIINIILQEGRNFCRRIINIKDSIG
jgi:2-polyprenyl-3-methyl-5-hydroxy-6-metoxy-1,4-benzoquinol methylase/glycosyltransferase involved in cell wall biosynthesis